MRWLPTSLRLWSVVRPVAISRKLNKIFTMEHYYEVGPLILLPGLGDCTLLGNALLTRHNLSKRYRLPDSVAGGADFYHMGDILVASDI